MSDLKTASSMPTPWYYSALIRIAKPWYRLKLSAQHRKQNRASQLANQTSATVDAPHTASPKAFEIQTRFGNAYPARPTNCYDNTDSSSLASDTNKMHLSHRLNASLVMLDNVLYARANSTPVVWCHAVSLGETNTIAPMLDVLLEAGVAIWLTNTTQTGFARGQGRFADYLASGQMAHSFVPVDDDGVIAVFLNHVQPSLALFVETELWANTLVSLKKRGVPSVLVNARLSQKSFQGYQRFRALSHSLMHNVSLIIAQDDASAKRFRMLGASPRKIRRADSLKWSSVGTTDGKEYEHSSISDRPIWVAGSTHEGEDAIVLSAHQQLLQYLPNALLILVPRHPERFDTVAEMVMTTGMHMTRRSELSADVEISPQTQVFLADSMGELMRWYEACDVAVVGGSLVDGIGGHNPIEPASFGKPIIMGSFVFSCAQLVDELARVGGLCALEEHEATAVTDALVAQLLVWLHSPETAKQAGQAGKRLVTEKSNAMLTQLTMIADLLEASVKHQIESVNSDSTDFAHSFDAS